VLATGVGFWSYSNSQEKFCSHFYDALPLGLRDVNSSLFARRISVRLQQRTASNYILYCDVRKVHSPFMLPPYAISKRVA